MNSSIHGREEKQKNRTDWNRREQEGAYSKRQARHHLYWSLSSGSATSMCTDPEVGTFSRFLTNPLVFCHTPSRYWPGGMFDQPKLPSSPGIADQVLGVTTIT